MPSVRDQQTTVHQIKAQLDGIRPPIWRRLVLPSDASLGALHDVIQVAFGWEHAHLHLFEELQRGGRRWSEAGMLEYSDAFDEDAATLDQVLPRAGTRLRYIYDFGDGWDHLITVEEVREAGAGEGVRAVCVAGRRAMPPAEDIGGVWGLAELLERYAAGDRPQAGEDEYDDLYGSVLAEMHAEDFDPAAFDPYALTASLSEVALVRGKPDPRRDGYRCPDCGDVHPLAAGGVPDDQDDSEQVQELLDAAGVLIPAVRLPGEAELAAAVHRVEPFMAAVRLGRWCDGGRDLTPKGVLRPKLARQAVEEVELWRIDPGEWGDAADRAARLAAIRSAGDMRLVDLPWTWGLNCGFIETDAKRAYPGEGLPDEGDDTALLAAYQEIAASAASEVALAVPGVGGMIGQMPQIRRLLEEMPPLSFVMLVAAYGLPDGEWVPCRDFVVSGMTDVADDASGWFLEALYGRQLAELAEITELFGVAEWENLSRPAEPGMILLFGTRPEQPALSGRMRLTPLGRSAVHALLSGLGLNAPVIGTLAEADAGDLLDAIGVYESEQDVLAEVTGWLTHRSPASAAAQVLDACAGTEPRDALRRLANPLVLEAVLTADEAGQAKDLLRTAAASGADGRARTAASMLRRIGEPPADQASWGLDWMIVDSLLPFARLGEETLRARLNAAAGLLDQLADHADDLWRARHPHGEEVLTVLASTAKPLDKHLAKRIRKAAFKAANAS
ncbi:MULTISPECIES: plasmid pRiA4b ORF-3 family protein [unclassified Spirillospora]|uniref:plasmid pRiA4b ORF-3 family protein n=1 Tax=unclassified Spirillospora TaxID=2642701 RepID=UPI0037208186